MHTLAFLITALAFLHGVTGKAERIDGIAVTIGKQVITESEVSDYVRLSAFLDGATPNFSAANRRKAAGQLVDRYLILQEAMLTRAALPTEAALSAVLEPMKAKYGGEAQFQAAMHAAGIEESDLRAHLLAGLRLLRYTDTRFRPEVQITDTNLRAFYADFIKKQNLPSNTAAPSFEESKDQIEQLLTNQLATEAMDRWLEMTRSESNIVYREAAFK